MSEISPVRTMPVRQLVDILGRGSLPEWESYRGTPIAQLPKDTLIATDSAFLAFWTQRCAEEVLAFQRILDEGDFLDDPVTKFFNIPEENRPFLQEREAWSMREWVTARLAQARFEEQRVFA